MTKIGQGNICYEVWTSFKSTFGRSDKILGFLVLISPSIFPIFHFKNPYVWPKTLLKPYQPHFALPSQSTKSSCPLVHMVFGFSCASWQLTEHGKHLLLSLKYTYNEERVELCRLHTWYWADWLWMLIKYRDDWDSHCEHCGHGNDSLSMSHQLVKIPTFGQLIMSPYISKESFFNMSSLQVLHQN